MAKMPKGFPIRSSRKGEKGDDGADAMLKPDSTPSDASEAPAPPKPAAPAPQAHSPFVASPVSATIATFLGLGGLFLIEHILHMLHIMPDPMLAVGSFAAVATLMYAAPAAPLGKPKNLFYGHFLSIVVSFLVYHVADALGWPMQVQVPLGVAISIGLMVQQKVPHPPAAACAFIFLQFGRAHKQPLFGALYMLLPGMVGCAWMLLIQRSVHYVADALYAALEARKSKSAGGAEALQPDGGSVRAGSPSSV